MTVASKLSTLSKQWKKVPALMPNFSNVPEGDYVAELKEMKLEESKKSARLQVVSIYEIADGEGVEGQTVKRFDGMDDEQNMGYFKGYCEILGMDVPEDLELLQETMDAFVAENTDLFEITVKQNDKYTNVYVNGVSDLVKAAAEGEEGQAVEEETPEEPVEEEPVEEEPVEETVAEEEVQEQQVVPPRRTVSAKKPTTLKSVPATKPAPIKKVQAAPPQQQRRTITAKK